MIFKGFKFGILLQFAVGPVCLYLFQTAVSFGLQPALIGIFGVFSAKIAAENLRQADMLRFGLGAVLSTLIFLSGISILGSTISVFLNQNLLRFFNLAVGIILLGFGVRILLADSESRQQTAK